MDFISPIIKTNPLLLTNPSNNLKVPSLLRNPHSAIAAWLAWGAWLCMMLGFSSISVVDVPPKMIQNYHVDWLFHIVEYLFFGVLSAHAMNKSGWLAVGGGVDPKCCNGLRVRAIIFAWASCFALLDERYQSIVPTRTMCVSDFLADCLGIALGIQIYLKKKETVCASSKTI